MSVQHSWRSIGARDGLRAGVDEAGRGPLAARSSRLRSSSIRAGAFAASAIRRCIEPEERAELAIKIRARALAWSVAWADVEEIDTLNILQATYLAMRRALIGLRIRPAHVQIDGNRCPSFAGLPLDCSFEAIIDGDALRTCIGAASILAKVTRDAMMVSLDAIYPRLRLRVAQGLRHAAALRGARSRTGRRRSIAAASSRVRHGAVRQRCAFDRASNCDASSTFTCTPSIRWSTASCASRAKAGTCPG